MNLPNTDRPAFQHALRGAWPAAELTPSRLARCCALTLLVLAPCKSWAVPVTWNGAGAAPFWSVAANWNLGRPPADGDAVVFAGLPAGASNTVDLSVRLDSLSFAATAGAFQVHVAGDGGRTLSFIGLGIQNLTGSGGPIRQSLYADAGSTGGSIVFAGASGINLGTGTDFRPVDLLALGGSASGQLGGRIVFQDQASTGLSTFNSLRAVGASAAGAGAGELIFRDDAISAKFTTLTMVGGTGVGAAGGQASFADGVQVDGIVNLLSGSAGGSGGRAVFTGSAVAGLTSTINNQGGANGAGSEGATEFRDAARLLGTVLNQASSVAGASGGRVEFRDQARFDSTGYDGSLGSLQIINSGGSFTGAGGGSVVFRDDSFARGSFLVIVNGGADAESTDTGTLGGTTRFTDRSQAGELTIYNQPGRGGLSAGQTSFENTSSAANAHIVMLGGASALSSGGQLSFLDGASAGRALIENNGGSAAGAVGGSTQFLNAATAADATIINAPGQAVGAFGGVTTFAGNAGAGRVFINNDTSPGVGGGGAGRTYFRGASSAQQAQIDNQGGLSFPTSLTAFYDNATADNARITNFGGKAAGVYGGFTQFFDRASAGAASIVTTGGGVDRSLGGVVQFFGDSTAGSATVDLRSAGVAGAGGAAAFFSERSSAGSATFIVQGSQVNTIGGPEAASVSFDNQTSASSASFTVGGNLFALGTPGRVSFNAGSTAANASFVTQTGFDRGGRLVFEGNASVPATAGNAQITNGSRATGSPGSGGFGGSTTFLARSSADRASIVNQAGVTAFGAQTVFRADSSAGDANIVNAGGRAGDRGGITFFVDSADAGRATLLSRAGALNATGITSFGNTSSAAQATITAAGASVGGEVGGRVLFIDSSTAAQATLVADGGSNGGAGGRIEFQQQATAGRSRVVLNAGSSAATGGKLDISGVSVWLPVGSIEGGGNINLGAKSLIVVGNGRATTFSGVIGGDAPAVFPSLTVQGGTLTLTGANLYAGRTSIGDGVNADSGKLVAANTSGSATGSGAVLVERGGTLGGSGFIAGPVTLLPGGTIAPGDPVTLTLRDSLTWDGGGVIRLVLGADTAGSDQLHVGTLIRGADGPFVFDLVDAGITAGTVYEFLSFDEMVGFAASDFQVRGFAGSFAFADGTLGFTASVAPPAVPEPSTYALLLLGLVTVLGARRRSMRAASYQCGATSSKPRTDGDNPSCIGARSR